MKYDQKRYDAFSHFAWSRDGRSLQRRIRAMARHYLSGHAAKIDANWHSIIIRFDSLLEPQHKLLQHSLSDADACRVEFNYRPESVELVGPNVGHVLLTEKIFEMIPEPLLAFVRMCDVLDGSYHKLHNLKHEIELIDGKTIIRFENCTEGVVRNVRGDEFDVECITHEVRDLAEDQKHFTRASLMAGFKIDGYQGQPVDVSYFPLLAQDGTSINTAEDLHEAERIAREAYEADRPRREAEEAVARAAQEAKEAEAYAALSPEERAKHDSWTRRLKMQARIAHQLLPLL